MNGRQRLILAVALAAFVGTLFYVPLNCFMIEPSGVKRLGTAYHWAWRSVGMYSLDRGTAYLWQIDHFRVAVEWTLILFSAVSLHFMSATPQGKPSFRDLT